MDVNSVDYLVKMIIYALRGCKDDPGTIGFEYLLGQCVRQYQVPKENEHVSVAAQALWNYMKPESAGKNDCRQLLIKECSYHEYFAISKDVTIPSYNGNSKKTCEWKTFPGKSHYVRFNSIFIVEHTTPVSDMIFFLKQLDLDRADVDISRDVESILNKMHTTRMLRCENMRIKQNNKRMMSAGINTLYDLDQLTSQEVFSKVVTSYSGLQPLCAPAHIKYPNKEIQGLIESDVIAIL